jgi:CRP/FNR family transcriptional regulator, anaerobic regulatory protein
MHDFPLMEARLLKFASTELVAAQEQMLLLGRKSAQERVASFLMARSRLAADKGSAACFVLPMARGDIADYLGITIETVVRTLRKLRDEGMIEVTNTSEVVICEKTALQRLASGSH